MAGWRYFATTLYGDGREDFLDVELPLTDVTITETVSGVNALDASLSVEVAHLWDNDGNPVFREWSTAFYAEKDGVIRGGGILKTMTVEDGKVSLRAEGFASYPAGMPYEGDTSFIDTDPLVIVRHIWDHLQGFEGGNIPVVLDGTTSPVRLGTEEDEVEFETGEGETVQFEAGPYRLNFWSTHDLGREIDALAEETPFDYRESHEWVGDTIRHRIELGYPSLGAVRTDLRFVHGENVTVPLRMDFDGDTFATEVVVLGAGEGRKMLRQAARVNTLDRLRRVAVVEAKDARSDFRARAIAEAELSRRIGDAEIQTVQVLDHPNAPHGSFRPGDVIRVQNRYGGWGGEAYIYVRILEVSYNPEDGDIATLTVTRRERAEL